MKSKIFAKLKQECSALGLGDEALMSRAASLADTGFVTDENIDLVIAATKRDLQEVQRLNDKRVNDALEKERKKQQEEKAASEKAAKEAAEKKAKEEAEAKAKAEADAKAAAEEAAKAAKEKEERKAKEAAAAKEREALEQSGKIPAELLSLLKQEREESEARIAAYKTELTKLMEESAAREKERQDAFAQLQTSHKSLMESSEALKSSYDALKAENDQAKAAKAKADRENFIKTKATELGVPQWRIDEGFVISEESDENAIVETLSKVANNIKTQQLPGSHNHFPQTTGEPTKEDVTDLAKLIVH